MEDEVGSCLRHSTLHRFGVAEVTLDDPKLAGIAAVRFEAPPIARRPREGEDRRTASQERVDEIRPDETRCPRHEHLAFAEVRQCTPPDIERLGSTAA